MADAKPEPDEQPSDPLTEELVAFLDGELPPEDAEALATRLTLDPRLRSQAERLQRTWDILDMLPRPRPSPNFASRTVSQLVAIPHPGAGHPGHSTMAMAPARSGPVGFWLVSAVVIMVAGLVGYVTNAALFPDPRSTSPDPPLEDVPLMKNLRLYRHVDDLEYLKKLDTPELFGHAADS